jgi:soluble lytic murein transglycosylase-like protein
VRERRISELLFHWETRHLAAPQRAMVYWWRRSRRSISGAAVGVLLFMMGAVFSQGRDGAAGAVAGPRHGAGAAALEAQLRDTQNLLRARQGELALAGLELNRLQRIVEHSQRHRIPADLAASIHDIAVSEGVDPALAFSLVRVESGFTRRAVSSAGAVGLTQVMPSTAFWLQPGLSYHDLFEPATNLRLGFRYLRMMVEQYEGDLHLALLAYNRGPNRVDEILSRGGDPSNGYDRLVRAGAVPPRKPGE